MATTYDSGAVVEPMLVFVEINRMEPSNVRALYSLVYKLIMTETAILTFLVLDNQPFAC